MDGLSHASPDEMSGHDLRTLIGRVREGDRAARDRLFELAYEELRRRARHEVARDGRRSLDTTALVHETYLKLSGADVLAPEDRRHFLLIAATAMRQVLVDRARRRHRKKRGGAQVEVDVDAVPIPVIDPAFDLVALDDALRRLEREDERLAQVVHLRHFAGLSLEETAEVLSVSVRTVKRDWRLARAFLHAILGPGTDDTRGGTT